MTQEEILSRLLSEISSEFDKSVGSFFYDTQKPLSIELETVYARIESILLNGFAATATGEYLDKKAAEQGITRKAATYSTGTATVSGNASAVISIGDKVASDTLVFTVTETKTIDTSGSATVSIVCDMPGKQGNVPIGAINRFPVTIAGLVSVKNLTASTGGFDTETDDELRLRYFENVSVPATSGNKYHYANWAKEVSGVGDVKVMPLWNGTGTVKVIIINSEKGAADETLIHAVTEYIEANRPIGASVTVESAVPLTVNISASVTLKSGYTITNISPLIEQAITAYLKKIAFEETYISYAHIGGAILGCEGILDYTNLLVNGATDNIQVAENQVPVLGTVTIS